MTGHAGHDEILADHRNLQQILTELTKELDSPLDAELPARLSEGFAQLRSFLVTHFRSEEQGTLFSEIPLKFPWLAAQVEGLVAEHAAITADLAIVLDRTEQIDGTDASAMHALKAQIKMVFAKILRHEAEENELITQAYWKDLGEEG